MAIQRCAGCGIESAAPPIIGVAQPTEELAGYQLDANPSAKGFVAYAVCAKCHEDPAARVRTLKMAFFQAGQAQSALQAAGSNAVNM